jgi:GNAT superfamily N-acetyltransferase
MPPDATVRIAQADATPAGLALLDRFYREAYVAQFPDPNERESLACMREYLRLKARGWYRANNYHVLVALKRGRPVGGAVIDYLAEPNAGILEFLFVLPRARGSGLARRLLDAAIALLRADARATGRPLFAVAAEMNDPYRHPDEPDNMDPFARTLIWDRWGFHRLLCPYVQPALSARQAPVRYLTLIVKPMARPEMRQVSPDWVRSLVAEYMRWAMRIDAPQRNREYRALSAWLRGKPAVALQPLAASIGRDAERPFDVEELHARHRAFDAALRLARREIPQAGRVASPAQFRAALAAARRGGPAYHLWRIAPPGRRGVHGMASFFSLRNCGFGGYLVLAGPLRGRGLLAPVLARMEARMMADGVRTPGWFIECGDDSTGAFLSRGFAEVPLEYRPPAVGHDAPGVSPRRTQEGSSLRRDEPERLHLLYKPFGAVYPPVQIDVRFVRRALRDILTAIYGLAAPARCTTWKLALRTLRAGADGRVVLRPGAASARGVALSARAARR